MNGAFHSKRQVLSLLLELSTGATPSWMLNLQPHTLVLMQVIFWDMRSAWCEHLYRHRVVGGAPFFTNIDVLIEALNQVQAKPRECKRVKQMIKLQLITYDVGVHYWSSLILTASHQATYSE